jgi:hypothetical protein
VGIEGWRARFSFLARKDPSCASRSRVSGVGPYYLSGRTLGGCTVTEVTDHPVAIAHQIAAFVAQKISKQGT